MALWGKEEVWQLGTVTQYDADRLAAKWFLSYAAGRGPEGAAGNSAFGGEGEWGWLSDDRKVWHTVNKHKRPVLAVLRLPTPAEMAAAAAAAAAAEGATSDPAVTLIGARLKVSDGLAPTALNTHAGVDQCSTLLHVSNTPLMPVP